MPLCNNSDPPTSYHRVPSLNKLVSNLVTGGASCSFAFHLHAHALLRCISNRAHSLVLKGLQILQAPRTPHYLSRGSTNVVSCLNIVRRYRLMSHRKPQLLPIEFAPSIPFSDSFSTRWECPNIVTGSSRKLVVWVWGIGKCSSKKRERERAFFASFGKK